MKLNFVEVTWDNLEEACKIQNEIFPTENGRENYIEGIKKDPYRKEMINYIVYDNNIGVGVVGIYSYHEYPEDAWLAWFGVLEKYRNKGYGSKMFDFFENMAREKGYKAIRLYTGKSFTSAIKLYTKKGMIKECYSNELESEEINNETLVFSKSLDSHKIQRWDNKFLELTAQVEKEK